MFLSNITTNKHFDLFKEKTTLLVYFTSILTYIIRKCPLFVRLFVCPPFSRPFQNILGYLWHKVVFCSCEGSNVKNVTMSQCLNVWSVVCCRIWKNMSLNDNLAAVERAQLAVWDYPVSDKYTKLWETMQKSSFPSNKSQAVERVLSGDFAFICGYNPHTVGNVIMWVACG